MAKVSAHYSSAVNLVKSTIAKGDANVALGLERGTPTDAEGWVTLLNKAGGSAPGGGAAYGKVSTDRSPEAYKNANRDGQILVSVFPNIFGTNTLALERPCYGRLEPKQVQNIDMVSGITEIFDEQGCDVRE
jgi:hypothetical protein